VGCLLKQAIETGSARMRKLRAVSAPFRAQRQLQLLSPDLPNTHQRTENSAQTDARGVAQIDIDQMYHFGGTSYIAGNIGLDGDTSLGEGSFMVISKVG